MYEVASGFSSERRPEPARSHSGSAVHADFAIDHEHCRSEPARDGRQRQRVHSECTQRSQVFRRNAARSRLAPTVDLRCTQILRSATNIVGASLLAMDVNDNACIQNARSGLRFFASRLAPTVDLRCMQILRSATNIVGASLLAMDVNDNACIQNARSGLRFFASRLAPTSMVTPFSAILFLMSCLACFHLSGV